MGPLTIVRLLESQRKFFATGATRPAEFREAQLRKLHEAIKRDEKKILDALHADMGKPEAEAYLGEVAFLYEEIRFALKRTRKWMKPKRVPTPWLQAISRSRIYYEPLGVALVIGPWNYPFQLLIAPLVAAISAGNCAVLKPSELAPHTSRVVTDLVRETFEPKFVAAVSGGVEVSQALLEHKWDHIFFTGGTNVGRVVAEAAAKHLTPTTLELGGKSPCLVDGETDLDLTARRVVWGKFFNAGQTCVAPDYILVPREMKSQLLDKMRGEVERFFGPDPAKSPDYARIINDRHFNRLSGLLPEGTNVTGGVGDAHTRYIAPTIKTDIALDAKVMQEEIFGPILPVIEVGGVDDMIRIVNDRPKPLALYFFSKNKERQRRVLNEISFGGGCVNDTLVHLSNPHMPFGGVGDSGLGAYHGWFGFETFSHRKSVTHKSFLIDPSVRYPPYGKRLGLIRRLMG